MSGFHHEALLYSGEAEFLEGTVPFLREGLEAGESALVVLPERRIAALRDALGSAGEAVMFRSMTDIGRNPACIIPAWQDFVSHYLPKGGVRGIGEPALVERSRDAMIECGLHERLLNVAFDGGPEWKLLCPYNLKELPAAVVEEARTTHPWVCQRGDQGASGAFAGSYQSLDWPLAEMEPAAAELTFDLGSLGSLRELVARFARRAGLATARIDGLLLAANEVATNAVRHGGGRGVAKLWRGRGEVVCEVTSGGRIEDPLAGRRRPSPQAEVGRGLWLANRLCDLVELRSSDAGTTVRLRVSQDRA